MDSGLFLGLAMAVMGFFVFFDTMRNERKILKRKDDFMIMVDSGHGLHDTGAVAIDGTFEKDYNREIAKQLVDLLRSGGYKVETTTDLNVDDYASISERRKIFEESEAKLLVSIHCNAYTNNQANGTEVLYMNKKVESLARGISYDIAKATGMVNRGAKYRDDLGLLKTTKPAIIVECGFITNSADLLKIKRNKKTIASKIYENIQEYYWGL